MEERVETVPLTQGDAQRLRVGFVIHRYGLEIGAGAERLCREVVERLVDRFDLEVITTCAQDYWTWANEYPSGLGMVNGVPVRRFETTRQRDKRFTTRSAWIHHTRHSLRDEMDWLHAQGPVVPGLLHYLARHRQDYDAFVFFAYLYYPTALGLRLVADRALLVPTAHDEPPLYLSLCHALFHSPRALVYNTLEEKRLVESVFDVGYVPNEVAGAGVETLAMPDVSLFRQRYGIETPYLLYVGRIGTAKNCHRLLKDFLRYKGSHPGPLTLVLCGQGDLPIPDRLDVVATGYVTDEEKFGAMAGAEVFVLPSDLESLSMVFLESLAVGTPVLCKGTSPVLRGHCQRSNAALYYNGYPEFEGSLEVLLGNDRLRAEMGRRGKDYVARHYSWERVVGQYDALIRSVAGSHWW